MLDLFPDYSAEYVRQLLSLPHYSNNAERLIESILDCSVPTADLLEDTGFASAGTNDEYDVF